MSFLNNTMQYISLGILIWFVPYFLYLFFDWYIHRNDFSDHLTKLAEEKPEVFKAVYHNLTGRKFEE